MREECLHDDDTDVDNQNIQEHGDDGNDDDGNDDDGNAYPIIVTGTMGGARVKIFCQV